MPTVPLRTVIGLLAVGLASGCGNTPAQEAAPPAAQATATSAASAPEARAQALIARGKSLELDTPYVPVPGDPLSHHASGFAKTMCSAVFITGLDLDFAAEHVGYFTAPYAVRARLGKPVLDRAKRTVSVAVPNGPTRVEIGRAHV